MEVRVLSGALEKDPPRRVFCVVGRPDSVRVRGLPYELPATLTVSFAQKQLSRRVSMSHDKPDEPAKSDAQRENEGSSDQRQRAGEREPKHDQQAKHACDYRPGLFKAVAHGAECMCRIDLRRAPRFVATHSCRSIGRGSR